MALWSLTGYMTIWGSKGKRPFNSWLNLVTKNSHSLFLRTCFSSHYMQKQLLCSGLKLSSQKLNLSKSIWNLIFWYINLVLWIPTWKSSVLHLKLITMLLVCAEILSNYIKLFFLDGGNIDRNWNCAKYVSNW